MQHLGRYEGLGQGWELLGAGLQIGGQFGMAYMQKQAAAKIAKMQQQSEILQALVMQTTVLEKAKIEAEANLKLSQIQAQMVQGSAGTALGIAQTGGTGALALGALAAVVYFMRRKKKR